MLKCRIFALTNSKSSEVDKLKFADKLSQLLDCIENTS